MNSAKQLIVADFLGDIGKARPEDEIMARHGLTREAFYKLRNKMLRVGLVEKTHAGWIVAEKRRLPTADILRDLRSGACREALMRRYLLPLKALSMVLKKLVEKGLLEEEETVRVLGESQKSGSALQRRANPRCCPVIGLTIRDIMDPSIQGKVRDISLTGVGVEEIRSYVDQGRFFEVLLEEFGAIKPLTFEAICKWSRPDQNAGLHAAGFEITRVLDGGLKSLREVIETTTFSMGM